MRSCVCDVRGAASIFIFCFWNQQHNDAIQSLLTGERKWHIWGPVVLLCVLWESVSLRVITSVGMGVWNGTHYCFKHMYYDSKNGYAQCTQYADGCLLKTQPLLCPIFMFFMFYSLFVLLFEGQIKTFFTMLSSLIFKCPLCISPFTQTLTTEIWKSIIQIFISHFKMCQICNFNFYCAKDLNFHKKLW